VEPAPLIVDEPPELAELVALPLEVAAGLELLLLELELEPQAATPSDAASASATADMRLRVKTISFICVRQSLWASQGSGVNQL
jgi:hypothetical protein